MILSDRVVELSALLKSKQLKLAGAESCTGGGIAYTLTEQAGSSEWFDCGFVTYSNEAKQKLLHVSAETLAQFGAVSEQTALAMAQGALFESNAQVSFSTTGIAGPGGGTAAKPVGTVWFAWIVGDEKVAERKIFSGNRHAVREQSILFCIERLVELLKKK